MLGNIDIPGLLLTALAVLITLTVHEYCHGYAAYKLGDNTAKNLGRLTLNPIKHLDPIGFLCMLLAGFGWAKPVPINSRNFKKPRYGIALTSFAGPASNLILAFIFILITRFSISPLVKMTATAISDGNTVVASLLFYLCLLLYQDQC